MKLRQKLCISRVCLFITTVLRINAPPFPHLAAMAADKLLCACGKSAKQRLKSVGFVADPEQPGQNDRETTPKLFT